MRSSGSAVYATIEAPVQADSNEQSSLPNAEKLGAMGPGRMAPTGEHGDLQIAVPLAETDGGNKIFRPAAFGGALLIIAGVILGCVLGIKQSTGVSSNIKISFVGNVTVFYAASLGFLDAARESRI
jgi:hypothetical protein